MKELDMKS